LALAKHIGIYTTMLNLKGLCITSIQQNSNKESSNNSRRMRMRRIGCTSQSVLAMLLLLNLLVASLISPVFASPSNVHLDNETRRGRTMEMEGAGQSSELLHVFSITKYELEEQQLAILGGSPIGYHPLQFGPAKSNPVGGAPYTGRPDSSKYQNPGGKSTGH
jgi:hypothetical protein